MRDDDVTVGGLGSDEVNEILDAERRCPCASNPRAKHVRWCQARAGVVSKEGESRGA